MFATALHDNRPLSREPPPHDVFMAGRVPGGRLELDLGNVRDLGPGDLGTLTAVGRRLRTGGVQLSLVGVTGGVFEAV